MAARARIAGSPSGGMQTTCEATERTEGEDDVYGEEMDLHQLSGALLTLAKCVFDDLDADRQDEFTLDNAVHLMEGSMTLCKELARWSMDGWE